MSLILDKIRSLFVLDNLKLKKLLYISLAIAFIGISVTSYLTIAHYTQTVTLACPTTSFINCEKVTSSSYSAIFGMPVSLIGLFFFVILFIIQLPIFWTKKYDWMILPRLTFVSFGLLSVFWFIYVELYKLHAICLYCTAVHVLTFLSFLIILIANEHTKITKEIQI